mgnify:CR=1 FL=1
MEIKKINCVACGAPIGIPDHLDNSRSIRCIIAAFYDKVKQFFCNPEGDG